MLRLTTIAVLLLFFATTPLQAWNNVGHRVIAQLAWHKMSPEERNAASELLKKHPHYKSILTADVPKGVDKNEWAFLMAAVWPDLVRPAKHGHPHKSTSVTKYDLYPHAVGYPFLLAGDTNTALLKDFFIAKPDAAMVLSNSIFTVKNKRATAEERAVSLCWMLHLFGDLHQPLHAANLVTKQHPGGDSLGGFHIILDENHQRISMHSFWDQLPGVDPNYWIFSKLTAMLEHSSELNTAAKEELQKSKSIEQWVQDSFHIAVDFAYDGGRLPFVHADDLESRKVSEKAIPALKSDYIRQAHHLADIQLLLAAQRLTDELNKAF